MSHALMLQSMRRLRVMLFYCQLKMFCSHIEADPLPNCDYTAMDTSSFHLYFRSSQLISLCVSFLSRVDELSKLASLQCMGLYSSDGRALQRERRGHGFESC